LLGALGVWVCLAQGLFQNGYSLADGLLCFGDPAEAFQVLGIMPERPAEAIMVVAETFFQICFKWPI
jgi:hypothetical protein